MSKEHELAKAEACVDYLTITTSTKEATSTLLVSLVEALGTDLLRKATAKPWLFKGFSGTRIDGAGWGTRGDEGIVMLSGPVCNRVWPAVAPLRKKCTRIDLAVTVSVETTDDSVAELAYNGVKNDPMRNSSLIRNSSGGSTCYVGSRTSQYFGRLYDKGSEQGGEHGKIWRYEVEVKKPSSEAIITSVLAHSPTEQWIAGYVWTWFEQRGIVPIFTADKIDQTVETEVIVTSVDRQLLWLNTQVKPTIERLVKNGFGLDVAKALGIKATQTELFGKDASNGSR